MACAHGSSKRPARNEARAAVLFKEGDLVNEGARSIAPRNACSKVGNGRRSCSRRTWLLTNGRRRLKGPDRFGRRDKERTASPYEIWSNLVFLRYHAYSL